MDLTYGGRSSSDADDRQQTLLSGTNLSEDAELNDRHARPHQMMCNCPPTIFFNSARKRSFFVV
jgi:hypothetical protein